jgi:flagellar capping protein FliD
VAVSALSSLSTGGGMFEVAKVVDQLMTVESAPLDKLNAKVESKGLVLDSIGLLKKSVQTLTSDLKSLQGYDSFSTKDDIKAVLQRVADSFTAVSQGITEAASIKLEKGKYTPGALTGDSLISGLKKVLADTWFDGVDFTNDLQDNSSPQAPYATATPKKLIFSELGLNRASDGTVTFDVVRFNKAATRIDLLTAFNKGASTKLYDGLNHAANFASGIFTSRTDQLNSELYKLSRRVDDLTSKLAVTKDRLTQQYSRYNAIIAQLQGSNNYLSSFLSSQNKSSG